MEETRLVHVTRREGTDYGGFNLAGSHERLYLLDEILRVIFAIYCMPGDPDSKNKSEALIDILEQVARKELRTRPGLRGLVEQYDGSPLFYLTNGK